MVVVIKVIAEVLQDLLELTVATEITKATEAHLHIHLAEVMVAETMEEVNTVGVDMAGADMVVVVVVGMVLRRLMVAMVAAALLLHPVAAMGRTNKGAVVARAIV